MPNDQTHEFKGVGVMPFARRYDNFIGGEWTAPKSGRYFTNTTPITGAEIGEIARSNADDIEAAKKSGHTIKLLAICERLVDDAGNTTGGISNRAAGSAHSA